MIVILEYLVLSKPFFPALHDIFVHIYDNLWTSISICYMFIPNLIHTWGVYFYTKRCRKSYLINFQERAGTQFLFQFFGVFISWKIDMKLGNIKAGHTSSSIESRRTGWKSRKTHVWSALNYLLSENYWKVIPHLFRA